MAEEEGLSAPSPPPEPEATESSEPEKKPPQKTTKSKIRLSREQWATAVLLVLTIELGLRAGLGTWKAVAAVHLVIMAIIVAVLLVRAAMRRTKRNAKTSSTNGSSTNTNQRRRPWDQLRNALNRRRHPNGSTMRRSQTPGGPSRSRQSPFGGLFSRKPRGSNQGHPKGPGQKPGGTGNRNPLSKLFSRKPRENSRSHPDGKKPGGTGSRNPFSGLFSRKPRESNQGHPKGPGQKPGGTGNRQSPFGGLFGRKPKDTKPTDHKSKKETQGTQGKKETPESGKAKKSKKPNDTSTPGPTQPDPPTEPTGEEPRQKQEPEQEGQPVTQPAREHEGLGKPKGESLHAWGRTLPDVKEAIDDIRQRQKLLETEIDALLSDINTLATTGETEQVRNTRAVVSQLQAIAVGLRQMLAQPQSAALAKISGMASTLWKTYLRDCGADEDRFNGARGTRRQERNADIGLAEQEI